MLLLATARERERQRACVQAVSTHCLHLKRQQRSQQNKKLALRGCGGQLRTLFSQMLERVIHITKPRGVSKETEKIRS